MREKVRDKGRLEHICILHPYSLVFILQLHHQRQRLSVGADVPTAALACDLVAEPVGCLCAQ